jgi:hypothetical protein
MIGTAFGMMISATTPTTPTVIEPGSMIETADFVIFKDGAFSYAKNGTTGQMTYSGANDLTVFNSVLTALPCGGMIYVDAGSYTFATPLIIDHRGIIISGNAGPIPVLNPLQSYGTILNGDVKIEAYSVTLENLQIKGELNFTSEDSLVNHPNKVANYCNANNIYVNGGLKIMALPGAAADQSPYNIAITNSFIWGVDDRNAINITTGEHIYFTGSLIWSSEDNSVIWMNGYADNTVFSDCVFVTSPTNTLLNLSGGGSQNGIRFIGCLFETNGATEATTFLHIGIDTNNYAVEVTVTDCIMRTTAPPAAPFYYLVADDTVGNPTYHTVMFTRLQYQANVLRVHAGTAPGNVPCTLLKFTDCTSPYAMTITQARGPYIGEFVNCQFVNPVGLMATPFSSGGWTTQVTSIASSWAHWALPEQQGYNVTVRDTAILLTVSGGSEVNVSVYDSAGNKILGPVTTLTNYYMPIGFSFTPTWSSAPTFTVIGI